jgi:hypothetical protein
LRLVLFSYGFVDAGTRQTVCTQARLPDQALGDFLPEIDGLINEACWDTVEWTGDYIENQPDENTPPTEQTKFKIVYDKKFLYFAFKCYDKDPKGIVKRLSRRDGFEGDWVEINIDSYHDKRTGFSFTISVSGVKGDEFISDNGNNWDSSWNPIWYMKTHIDDEGWTAKSKSPSHNSSLAMPRNRFGDCSRHVVISAPKNARSGNVSPDAPGWVSEFGELRGITDIEPQKQVEIQPFVVAQQESYPEAGNPFRDGNDKKLNGGLDAKIGLTNDLTLDLTINPDFGVEADPAAIALDGFQIFFEEKRPFLSRTKTFLTLGLPTALTIYFIQDGLAEARKAIPVKAATWIFQTIQPSSVRPNSAGNPKWLVYRYPGKRYRQGVCKNR